ncbi:tryptophan-rich sensory protein [Desertihabitans brevis]|uniref:Tryptophan-rich sensory protein n=1 Tax=Desertihabitans brevis TaxID=2268447 RepID=A0A367YSI4_9ACTN|nr:tryptophan-rich sensory protein [Desertihabitans brevis]RCK68804.1 tryptophan-rich sensory protein [Desertihabitans brevis]
MLSESSSGDLARRVVTTAAELFCLVGTAVGTGLLGTAIEDAGQGSLSAQATLVAPAGPAFSIWSVIYLGLFAFTVWQWLPRNAADARLRRLGYLPAASMVLNAVWILVAQTGLVWLTAVVIVALLAVLALIALRLGATGSGRRVETLMVDGTFGLYLGWVAVATCANLAAALVDLGVEPGVPVATVLGVVLVAGAVAAALARRFGGRVAVGLAVAWGLVWVAVGRLTDAPQSAPVAVAALVAAAVALGAVAWVRLRRDAGTSPPTTG